MKLLPLLHSERLAAQLREPSLRQLMVDIDASTSPRDVIKQHMQSPVFVEFADACLAAVGESAPPPGQP